MNAILNTKNKKEAFGLFERLLEKIKNDTISILNNKIPRSSQVLKNLISKQLLEISVKKEEKRSIEYRINK